MLSNLCDQITLDFLTIYDSLDYYKMSFMNMTAKLNILEIGIGELYLVQLYFSTRKSNLYDTKIIFDTYSNKNNFDSSYGCH